MSARTDLAQAGEADELPGLLAQVEAAAGRDVALLLADLHGGRVLYIPQEPAAESLLAQAVGLDAAIAIRHAVGWGQVRVPAATRLQAGRRRTLVLTLHAQGVSQQRIAREVRISVEWVRRILRAAGR